MLKEALQYLMNFRDVETIEYDGQAFASRQLVQLPELKADHVVTKSLASIVDLVATELDHSRISGKKIFIQVVGPTKVEVYTSLGDNLNRLKLYGAVAETPNLQLNTFIDLETMNIHLKSCFIPADERDTVIAILGNVKEEAVKTSSDDGFSQSVVAKTGIATVGNVSVPPIVQLTPFRTFVEVPQPTSEFLLRLKSGPSVALFEADGGAWKAQARHNIRLFFEEALEQFTEGGRVVVLE